MEGALGYLRAKPRDQRTRGDLAERLQEPLP